jgi:hypothetical protein
MSEVKKWTKYNNSIGKKEYNKKYFQENKERIAERQKKWYNENKLKCQETGRRNYHKNKEQRKEHQAQYYQQRKIYCKKQVLFHYTDGNNNCNNCGENIFEFLTVDHINGGGNEHRKSIGFTDIYAWLIRNKFPNGFQILCYNCNCAKHRTTPKRYNEIIIELRNRNTYFVGSIINNHV